MKQTLQNHLKNIPGWKTKRKLIAFAVDDYGNVRLHSPEAYSKLKIEDVPLSGRFDHLDTLETRQDLSELFETLQSVKDQNGKHAVFTPYALPCNINFDAIKANGFDSYAFENLPETFKKLEAELPATYSGTYKLLLQGIEEGLYQPEFHGREHLNLQLFEYLMKECHPAFMKNIELKSYAGIPKNPDWPTIGFTQAYSFWDEAETKRFPEIIRTGIAAFEKVYGYKPVAFTPPAQQYHESMEPVLLEEGIRIIDKPLFTRRHLGKGKYKREFNATGVTKSGYVKIVRNVVFEPTEKRDVDWVSFALSQIEAAFRWNKPAAISSHRVNFCGFIDPDNRREGLDKLRQLLKEITKRWPDAEFVSIRQLGEIISEG